MQTFKENPKRKCQKVLLAITEKAKMEIKINNKNKKTCRRTSRENGREGQGLKTWQKPCRCFKTLLLIFNIVGVIIVFNGFGEEEVGGLSWLLSSGNPKVWRGGKPGGRAG